jgi:ParB-like chromosome segregation protein Spo0J
MTTKTHDLKASIEYISVDKLVPYARNSRTHSDAQVAQIAASIKEFGFTNPVLIDGGGGGDHCRTRSSHGGTQHEN